MEIPVYFIVPTGMYLSGVSDPAGKIQPILQKCKPCRGVFLKALKSKEGADKCLYFIFI